MTARMSTQASPEPLDLLAQDRSGEDPDTGESGNCDLGITVEDLYRLTVAQYHAIAAAGILDEEDPVELLEGWLIRKMTQKPAHPVAVDLVRETLSSRLGGPWHVRVQAPITLSESEPEPDVALVRGDRRDYLQHHPRPGDVLLVVEVADTSLARDRGVKKQTYAQAGIPLYWIVNLLERKIEVYTDPSNVDWTANYAEHCDYSATETIRIVIDNADAGYLVAGELLP